MDVLLDRLGMPTKIPGPTEQSELVSAAGHDKKRIHATIRLPVVDRIGSAQCIVVQPWEVPEMFQYLDVAAPSGEQPNAATMSETR
jgi:3-dehydroquinate synthetase